MSKVDVEAEHKHTIHLKLLWTFGGSPESLLFARRVSLSQQGRAV